MCVLGNFLYQSFMISIRNNQLFVGEKVKNPLKLIILYQ